MSFLDDVLDNVGKEWKGGKGFEAGTHKVNIGVAEADENNGRPLIKVTVFDPADDERTAQATLWFHTEGGAKMAVAKVLGLLVHSKTKEEDKEKVRSVGKKLFGSIDTPEKALEVCLKLLQDKLIGKEAFLVVTIDNPKYTTSQYGDLWHYPREETQATDEKPKVDVSKAPGVDSDDVPDFNEEDI